MSDDSFDAWGYYANLKRETVADRVKREEFFTGDFIYKDDYRKGAQNIICKRTGGLCNTSKVCSLRVCQCKEGYEFKPAGSTHWPNGQCWCKPELDYIDNETGNLVFIHRN